ncbi:site-specific integrase, partial [Listeria monocytogenes]|nr:site-specific integrase [Listeria monocytogenes]
MKRGEMMSAIYEQYDKRKQKLWRFKCYLGKNEFGKDVRTTRSGYKTKKEAQQAYRHLQMNFDNKLHRQSGHMTFEQLYDEFLKSYRNKVKPSTIMILRRAIEDHALPYIGKKKISDITVRFCTRMNDEWIAAGFKQAYYF